MALHTLTAARIAAPAGPRPLATLLAALDVWRQRRALERLESHRLEDLGLGRGDALREAKRPIWDAPNHWQR